MKQGLDIDKTTAFSQDKPEENVELFSSIEITPEITPENTDDKLFYKIGEVSKITNTPTFVLRYWESEFPFLKPMKSSSGHRIYQKKNIKLILEIKRLLHEERFTVEGVRKKIQRDRLEIDTVCELSKTDIQHINVSIKIEKFERLKKNLTEVLDILRNNGA